MGGAPLLGRAAERRRIGALVGGARNGRGGALLVVGEPGIGKTALLDAAGAETGGVRWIRLDGYETEAMLPFAAVQRLTIPLREHLGAIPGTYRQALDVAAGAAVGPPPDRFLVGLGILALLAAAGSVRPVVCSVDDAHLLDPESLDVLAFIGRRVEAESAVLLLAARDDARLEAATAGIPSVRLAGLDLESSVRLLRSSVREVIDPAAAAQIAAATGGNPLALIDLATELSVARLTETSIGTEPVPVGQHLEAFYLRRVRVLPAEAQLWLLIAAADSTADVDLVTAAARELDVTEAAVDAAEAAGLVDVSRGVHFRHPLVKSAAYNAARGSDRRRVHRALSRAAQDRGLVEVEAWHAAKATLGTDPAVADRLEVVADLAGRRGGFASRARVLAQAASLSPAGPARGARLVAAAEAALAAGAAHLAKSLVDDVDEDLLDPVVRGRMISVRAAHALFTGDPALTRAGADMLEAARCFHGHDVVAEQKALIKAFEYTLPSERLTQGLRFDELGHRLRDGADLADGVASTILRALGAHVLLPYDEAVPLLRQAADVVAQLPPDQLLEYGSVSVVLTTALWDNEARRAGLERTAVAARDAGSLQLLDTALWVSSLAELTGGTPRRATEQLEQVRELRRAIGYEAEHVVNVALLAWSDAPRAQVQAIADGAAAMGFGGVQSSGVAGLAVRDLAEGRYRDALDRLRPLIEDPFLQVTPLEYPDYVEAAVRCGRAAEITGVMERLESIARANRSPWAVGVTHRCRGLLAPDDEAEDHYTSAIAALTEAGTEVDLGRAHLVYGEWLRRRRRRREAKVQLRAAADLFERAGAGAFLGRAQGELEATGEPPGTSPAPGLPDLTAQELTVARMAAAGQTNAEIGATMFLSANTVDYHLRKVFQKLGISSRRQLADRLHPPG